MPTARDVAVETLRDREGNLLPRLGRLMDEAALDARDRGLARELVSGVARHSRCVDTVLRRFLQHPRRRLPRPMRQIFHVAIYQILFLDRVPDFAAVDEAVRQTIDHHHKRQSGLVNGVLRAIAREASELQSGPPPLEPTVVPVGRNAFRRMTRRVFPDPAGQPAEYLATAYSLPTELARRWVERFGWPDGAVEQALQALARPPLIARVNTLRATVADVVASLVAEGIDASLHSNGRSVVIPEAERITRFAAFAEGLIQPQDPTATAVGMAMDVQPGMAVLDFCAAPGTKTTHLAERMRNRGNILAVDVSAEKIERIDENCRRLGVDIVETRLAPTIGELELRSFDRVLVDVPCSNTGVLARRPEARWRFSRDALNDLVSDQLPLLSMAAQFVRPGGRLVYSTCSIEPEENTQIARKAEKRVANIRLLEEHPTLPGGADDATRWHDGGYTAIFEGL